MVVIVGAEMSAVIGSSQKPALAEVSIVKLRAVSGGIAIWILVVVAHRNAVR